MVVVREKEGMCLLGQISFVILIVSLTSEGTVMVPEAPVGYFFKIVGHGLKLSPAL